MRHDQQGFTSKAIHLEHEIGGVNAILTRSLTYIDKDGVKHTAHTPMPTDGGTIYRFFYRIIGPPYASPYLGAYIIHDDKCIKAKSLAIAGLYGEAVVERQEGDLLFEEILEFLGCPSIKRKLMYKGVRVGAKSLNKYRPKKDEKKMK